MTVAAGELWLVDRGEATRRLVFVISEARFHRLGERAVVVPVLEARPASPRPWHVPLGDRAVAVNQLATMPIDRLRERVDRAGLGTLRLVRRAVWEIAN